MFDQLQTGKAKLCVSMVKDEVHIFLHLEQVVYLGSSVHGISQARILEWVAISFSRGSSQPRD